MLRRRWDIEIVHAVERYADLTYPLIWEVTGQSRQIFQASVAGKCHYLEMAKDLS